MTKKHFHVVKVILFALPILFLLTHCSRELPKVPPITAPPSGEEHPGKFVWHDLMTTDIEAVKKFYGELFGWNFEDVGTVDVPYEIIRNNGKIIGGIFALDKSRSKAEHSQWISFISVENMETAVEHVKNNNGNIYTEPFDLPDRGKVAVAIDPQGAVLALVNSSTGDTKDKDPIYNEWLWTELWTDNVDASLNFYNGMFGYENKVYMTQADTKYYVLRNEDEGRAGVVKIMLDGVKPNWMPYIAVKDPSETISKVEQLGGKVLIDQKGIAGNKAAIIADPSGGVFTVHIWPIDRNAFKEIKE
jgi:predicted enzyme related to lactoylglutathione lyase